MNLPTDPNSPGAGASEVSVKNRLCRLKTQRKFNQSILKHRFSIKIEIMLTVSPWFGMPLLNWFNFPLTRLQQLQVCMEIKHQHAAANGKVPHRPSYLLFDPWLSNIWTWFGASLHVVSKHSTLLMCFTLASWTRDRCIAETTLLLWLSRWPSQMFSRSSCKSTLETWMNHYHYDFNAFVFCEAFGFTERWLPGFVIFHQ